MGTSAISRNTEWLYFGALLVFLLCVHGFRSDIDVDLWGVMASGALLDQNPGFFPFKDVFSYTAWQQPWVYHEWGSGLIFFQIFKHFGSYGLVFFGMLVITATMSLTWRLLIQSAHRQPPESARTLVLFFPSLLLFALMAVAPFTLLRCQLFTYLGFVSFLSVLEAVRHGKSLLLLLILPPLMLLWANVHGGFILGFFLMGLYGAGFAFQRDWRKVAAMGACLLAAFLLSLVNPYGWALYEELFEAWSLPRTDILEWDNVIKASLPWGSVYTVLLLVSPWLGFRHWLKNRSQYPFVLLLFLATGIEGWLHFKLAPLFLLAQLALGLEFPLPALHFWDKYPNLSRRLHILMQVAPFAMLICIAFVLSFHPPFGLVARGKQAKAAIGIAYPLEAIRYLQTTQQQGNLWTPFNWGEFAIWNLYPQFRVSMDGRYETVYDEQTFLDSKDFYFNDLKTSVLEKYPQTTHLLIPANNRKLLEKMAGEPQWRRCHQDSVAAIFSRNACPPDMNDYPGVSVSLDKLRGDLSRFKLPDELKKPDQAGGSATVRNQ